MRRSAWRCLVVGVLALYWPLMAQGQTLPTAAAITTTGPIVGSTMTLVWGAVSGASHYRIRVEDTAGIQVDDYYRPDQVGCTASAICELTVATASLTAGAGRWWVQAWSATAEGSWSEPKGFTYAHASADAAFVSGGLSSGSAATPGEMASRSVASDASDPADPDRSPSRILEGPNNTALGTGALVSVTGGTFNTALGVQALQADTSGAANTAVGGNALWTNTTGFSNSAVGINSLFSNQTGALNSALGAGALQRNTTATYNTAVGGQALYFTTSGNHNTGVGGNALWSNSTGYSNTAVGLNALFLNSSGALNVALGFGALIGNTTGIGNLAIGPNAGANQTTGNNSVYLHHPGVAGESNVVRIGTPGLHTQTFLAGTVEAAGLHVSGNAVIDGNIAAKYQDVAEWVSTAEALADGTVVVVDAGRVNHVATSRTAYSTSVAGAVSPQPGLILGEAGAGKVLVAQSGRVRVKVDASYGAITAGDLLVTSPTPGHAMRSEPVDLAGTPIHRPGTLVGKALESLTSGQGEILVLLTLQ